MPTWCGNQHHVRARMTISLRPVHILSDIMATYADREITQQSILRCRLDKYNGTVCEKIWLIGFTDNSQVFWVLSAVCFVGSNLGSDSSSTFQFALFSTHYWFPFRMWRPSHSDHNLLINVSCSSSPALVITTIREIEHLGTTPPASFFSGLSFPLPCFFFTLVPLFFLSSQASCFESGRGVLAGGDKHLASGHVMVMSFTFKIKRLMHKAWSVQ